MKSRRRVPIWRAGLGLGGGLGLLSGCGDHGSSDFPMPVRPAVVVPADPAIRALEAAYSDLRLNQGDRRAWAEWTLLMVANDYIDEATEALGVMRTLEPEEAKWFFLSARHEGNFGDPTVAVSFLEEALRLAPRELVLLWERAQWYLKSNNREGAENAFRTMIALNPRDPYGHLGIARILVDEEEWIDTRTRLDVLLAGSPEFAPGLFLQAKVLSHLGQTREAHQSNVSGSQAGRYLQPETPWLDDVFARCFLPYALEVRAAVLMLNQRWQDALELLDRAREIDPGRSSVYYESGRALSALGHFGKALEAFERALELRPGFREVYPELAKVCVDLGRSDLLQERLRTATEILPDFYYPFYQLGLMEMDRGEPSIAKPYLRRAAELSPDDERIWRELAECARLADDHALFEFGLNGLVEHFHESESVRAFVGKAWIQLKRWDRIDELMEKVPKQPLADDAALYLKRANQALRTGLLWQGFVDLNRVLAIEPNDPTALYNLGNFFCRYGALERGLVCLENVLHLANDSNDTRQYVWAALGVARVSIELDDLDRAGILLEQVQARILEEPEKLGSLQEQHDRLAIRWLDRIHGE